MKIENQVCTFEQAVKLNELGVLQESAFCWKQNTEQTVVIDVKMKGYIERYASMVRNEFYSAFTVAELGVMLGSQIYRITKEPSNSFLILEKGLDKAFFYACKTEAEARAALLIFLIEKEVAEVNKINQRLQNS